MRLVSTCLSLSWIVGSVLAAGQQPQPTTSQKLEQPSAVKQSSHNSSGTATKHSARHHSRKTATQKSGQLCQAPEFSVDVITGAGVRHTCFDPRAAGEESKSSPSGLRVEVINGSAANTQYFLNNQEIAHNQPVVVSVQSSDTRYAGGNKRPVVTSVNSSSSVDAKSSSSGGQTVTNGVSPRPKRPAYQPDEH